MNRTIVLDFSTLVNFDLEEYLETLGDGNVEFLSLSPCATFHLEKINRSYLTFHDYVSQQDFRDEMLTLYEGLKKVLLSQGESYLSYFYSSIQTLTYINYALKIKKIINLRRKVGYKAVYISDRKEIKLSNHLLSNSYSLHPLISQFEEVKFVSRKKNFYQTLQKPLSYITKFLHLNPKDVQAKVFSRKKGQFKYDWLYIRPKVEIHTLESKFDVGLLGSIFSNFLKEVFDLSQTEIDRICPLFSNNVSLRVQPYTTYAQGNDFLSIIAQKKRKSKIYMYQHGSYLYYGDSNFRGSDLVAHEIFPADVNFVYNDYTKKIFRRLGAKKVYTVGSIFFNYKIRDEKEQYDFLYIMQGHDYLGNLQYIDFPNSLHCIDGHNLYQRHKKIISFLGQHKQTSRIMLRPSPAIVSDGVYVPIWELATKYRNIKVDLSTPIRNLIEKSKYIISDYFSSDFINRELHYKKDIILFSGPPTPLPMDTIDDMNKLFILVNNVSDLKRKLSNLDFLISEKKRNDSIIEYYSSKKCDTKKSVLDIIGGSNKVNKFH